MLFRSAVAGVLGAPISPQMVVRYQDSIHLKKATIALTNGVAGDSLLVPASSSVAVSYDAATFTATLTSECACRDAASPCQHNSDRSCVQRVLVSGAFTAVGGTCSAGTTDCTSAAATVSQFDNVLQGAKFTSSKIADLSFSTREIHFTVTDSDNHTSPPASRTVAITCAAGSYADGPTSTCKTCAAGKWSAGDHTVTCTACAAGKHGFGQDQTSEAKYCFQCGAGSYSATGSHGDVKHTCTKCSPGTYGASNYAQTSVEHCRACENGKAQDLSGQTACNDCTAGTYNDGKEFSMKVQCRAWDCCKENGEYLNGGSATENTQCLQCPVGSFLKVSGALENAQDLCHDVRQCTLCRAGTWGMGNATKTSEKAECAACAAGKFSKYSHDANSEIIMHDKPDSCKKCAAGKYQDQEGQSSCSVCDLGSYAPAGTPSCTKCEAGRYGNSGILPAANLGHCTVCENGQYQDGTGATACKTCTMGAKIGRASCRERV